MCFLVSALSTIANTIWNVTKTIWKSIKTAIQSATCPRKKEESSSGSKQTSPHSSDLERCETFTNDLNTIETVQQDSKIRKRSNPTKNLDRPDNLHNQKNVYPDDNLK